MSDNGLPAELPSTWAWSTISEITKNFDGQRVPVKAADRKLRNGAYPYYGASGIIDGINDFLFEGDYLLIAEDGANLLSRSTPIAFRAGGRFWVNNHAHVVQTLGSIPLNYLEQFLNRISVQFYVTGTAQPKLNQVNLNRIPVPVAPLSEQRRIVAKIEELFSDLDAGVGALERAKANLKRYRSSVLKAAVEGRLTTSWRADHPDVEPASDLLARILKKRRQRWEADQLASFAAKGKQPPKGWKDKYEEPAAPDVKGLPELPDKWCWATWDQLSTWVTYGFTRPMSHVDVGVPIVTAKHVRNGRIDLESTHLTPHESFAALSEKDRPKGGDILITKDGSIGRAAVVSDGQVFCINQSVAVIWLRGCPVNRRFLLAVIESDYTQKPIHQKARGVAIQHLSITDFKKLPLPLPPLQEQEVIVDSIDTMMSILHSMETALEVDITRASRLRQSILKRAFEGKLVPQDPHDEPATALLARIQTQRAATAAAAAPAARRKKKRAAKK